MARAGHSSRTGGRAGEAGNYTWRVSHLACVVARVSQAYSAGAGQAFMASANHISRLSSGKEKSRFPILRAG